MSGLIEFKITHVDRRKLTAKELKKMTKAELIKEVQDQQVNAADNLGRWETHRDRLEKKIAELNSTIYDQLSRIKTLKHQKSKSPAPKLKDKTKRLINESVLLLMEKAARLKAPTGFEKRLLHDRMTGVEQFSLKAVISVSQLEVITAMASRYDALIGGEDPA